jgi:hypothetical protein
MLSSICRIMNQQEQIAQGSLRSSHRNTHAVIFKKPNQADQAKAIEFLSSSCKDSVISQRINSTIGSSNRPNFGTNSSVATYAEIPLKKGTFFVNSTSSRAEPGFLVFIPKSNPIFLKYNMSKREREINRGQPICYTLRMRVSPEVYEGSVLIATLDGIAHSLVLEDVYVWRKQNIFYTQSFTKRRECIKEFVQHHWIPDVRLLGGITTEIMNPKPLDSLKEFVGVNDFTKVFLIPEAPGKRRFTFNLNESIAKIQDGYYGRKQEDKPAVPAKVPETKLPETKVPETKLPETKILTAKAVRDTMLPDIYELFDVNGNSLNKACVQQLELSKMLKAKDSKEILVNIEYNNDFKRYEIVSLCSPNVLN